MNAPPSGTQHSMPTFEAESPHSRTCTVAGSSGLPHESEPNPSRSRPEDRGGLLELRPSERSNRLGRVLIEEIETIQEQANLRRPAQVHGLLNPQIKHRDSVQAALVVWRDEDVGCREAAVCVAAVRAGRSTERAVARRRSRHAETASVVLAGLEPI